MAKRPQFDLVPAPNGGVVRVAEHLVASLEPREWWDPLAPDGESSRREGCMIHAGQGWYHVKQSYDEVQRRLGWKR